MFELVNTAGKWSRDWLDLLAAVVLTAATAVIMAIYGLLGSLGTLPSCLSILGFMVLVAWRRNHPVAVAAAAGALVALPELGAHAAAVYGIDAISVPALAALFLYAYALGSYCPWARSLIGLVPLTAGFAVIQGYFNPFIEMATVGPWLGGLAVSSRRQVADQLEVRARELEEEREIFALQSVRYERARIARELHDIVAHSVSLIVVQASAGERLAARDPDGAAEAFESIGDAAKQAEDEIDRLVDLLDTSLPPAPSVGLRIVEELVDRAQASGLRVTCQLSGDNDALSEPATEAVYRLVQEALTNAMKHAPGAPIDVAVRGKLDAVEVEVDNQQARGSLGALEGSGGGHGLDGMRERVLRCGGSFEAGATTAGGWRVTASLPRLSRSLPSPGLC
jgi:signal transduction histidine kinase